MGNFNRDSDSRGGRRGGFGGGRRSFGHSRFGGRSNFGRNDRGDRQMFNVVCSNCGKDCQVPFNPTGDKPVYCSDCFEKMGGGGRDERRSFSRPRYDDRNRSDNNYKDQLESIDAKLDKILNLLQPKEITVPSPVEIVETPVEKTKVKAKKTKKTSEETK